jgi:Tetracyclin repressor-like, C-terminal domain
VKAPSETIQWRKTVMPLSSATSRTVASAFSADEVLLLPTSSWDKRIATDLIAEIEVHLGDRISTLPEMRRILAVKGYQGLRRRIEYDIEGKSGLDALRAMAFAMRSFALERPGLTAATFRTAVTDSPEWREALAELSRTVFCVFADIGLEGEAAQHALRVLRSFVRGYVLNEMAASFLEPLDYQQSFELGIEMFILGLPALGPQPRGQQKYGAEGPVQIPQQALRLT